MRLAELDYELGPENVATEPREIRLGRRDLGRMLVVERATGKFHDSAVWDLPGWLQSGDLLVLNDSKRLPGVLKVRTRRGAQVELRVTRLQAGAEAIVRAFPAHFIRPGTVLTSRSGHDLVVSRVGIGRHGLCEVRSSCPLGPLLEADGLPITSFFYSDYWEIEHYNPVYAKASGSVESPMAGLHFTTELLARVESAGVRVAFLTLHVVGSWLPFHGDTTEDYEVQIEPFSIPETALAAYEDTRRGGGRVVAVGTTSVRALESAAISRHTLERQGESDLLISPGHQFRAVDAYFTNFHPARSCLMALDAAFCDRDLLLAAYRHARENGYLFNEFGDAIFFV